MKKIRKLLEIGSYHEELLNTECTLDRNSLSRGNAVTSAPQVVTRTCFNQSDKEW